MVESEVVQVGLNLFSHRPFSYFFLTLSSLFQLGYRGVTTDFTYSWKPVNNTNFAVCIVIASDELDTKVMVDFYCREFFTCVRG